MLHSGDYLLWNFLLFENYGQEVGGPIHCWSSQLKSWGGPVSPCPYGCCAYAIILLQPCVWFQAASIPFWSHGYRYSLMWIHLHWATKHQVTGCFRSSSHSSAFAQWSFCYGIASSRSTWGTMSAPGAGRWMDFHRALFRPQHSLSCIPTTSPPHSAADDICCAFQAETFSEIKCTLTADLAHLAKYSQQWCLKD